jgi:hypothetical protein
MQAILNMEYKGPDTISQAIRRDAEEFLEEVLLSI